MVIKKTKTRTFSNFQTNFVTVIVMAKRWLQLLLPIWLWFAGIPHSIFIINPPSLTMNYIWILLPYAAGVGCIVGLWKAFQWIAKSSPNTPEQNAAAAYRNFKKQEEENNQ